MEKNYQLIVNIPLQAIDDMEVRKKMNEIFVKMEVPETARIKLQEVYNDRQPRAVNL